METFSGVKDNRSFSLGNDAIVVFLLFSIDDHTPVIAYPSPIRHPFAVRTEDRHPDASVVFLLFSIDDHTPLIAYPSPIRHPFAVRAEDRHPDAIVLFL